MRQKKPSESDGFLVKGVLILRNSSLKLKTVVSNAILLNYAVSPENISERIKIQTENGFHLKVNVCKFRRNKRRPGKQLPRRHLFISFVKFQISRRIREIAIEIMYSILFFNFFPPFLAQFLDSASQQVD